MRGTCSTVIRHLHRNSWSNYRTACASSSTTKIGTASFVRGNDTTNRYDEHSVTSILEKVSNGTLSIKHAKNEILQMKITKGGLGNTKTPTPIPIPIPIPTPTPTPTPTVGRANKNRSNDKTSSSNDESEIPIQLKPFANLDHDRAIRTSFPEVVFGHGKTSEQLAAILDDMAHNVNELVAREEEEGGAVVTHAQKAILATRVSKELYEQILSIPLKNGTIFYHETANIITMTASALHTERSDGEQASDDTPHDTHNTQNNPSPSTGTKLKVIVACAGTTDIPVAEEAAVTLEAAGCDTERIYDVGVAGLHRIISAIPKLRHPDVGCIIVCAGMDGALPSVVAGLVSVPVIAVPTSVGYGASFGGMSAMLTMLNSCAPGVGVVNIDNGFGGAALAHKCIRSNHLSLGK